jgi:hypothetical protein
MRATTSVLAAAVLCAALPATALAEAPVLKGFWKGTSVAVTAKNLFKETEIKVGILDQQGNRFWGTTTHGGETEKMVGVIRGDGKTFYWVDVEDSGLVQGTILAPDKLETCYLESGDHAIAACSILTPDK